MRRHSFLKFSLLDICILILGIILIFLNPLSCISHFFNYFGEILIIFVFIMAFFLSLKKRLLKKRDIKIISLFILFILIGLVSNFAFKVNLNNSSIIFDIFSFSKFILFAICGIKLFECTKNSCSLITIFSNIIKINLIIALPLAILSQFVDTGLTLGVRYGIKCFAFIYASPAHFSWYCLTYLLILMIDNLKFKKNNKLFIYLNLIVWCFTCRSRGIAFCFIYLVLDILNNYYKVHNKKLRFKFSYIIIIGIIALLISWKQMVFYFTTSREARYILFTTSLVLAKNYFPFGAGFGTFGTSASSKFYSPIYYSYGLSNIYGFSEESTGYITDNCWPAVLGETGIIGLIIYGFLIYQVFKYLYDNLSLNNYSKMIVVYFIITILCSSIATSIFMQDATIGDLFFLCMIPGIYKEVQNKQTKNKDRKESKN